MQASVAHVIKCKAEEITYDSRVEDCFDQMPILRKTPTGEWGNTTWFWHPISKVIQPRGTRVTCSKLFPQQWKLSTGEYLCKAGRDILPCAAPDVLQPSSNDLHDQLDEHFHLSMGHGIVSTKDMKANQMRANELSYKAHLEAEMIFRNKKNIEDGKPLEPEGSDQWKDALKAKIANFVNPLFAWLGEGFQYFLGIVVLASMIMAVIGTAYRYIFQPSFLVLIKKDQCCRASPNIIP